MRLPSVGRGLYNGKAMEGEFMSGLIYIPGGIGEGSHGAPVPSSQSSCLQVISLQPERRHRPSLREHLIMNPGLLL